MKDDECRMGAQTPRGLYGCHCTTYNDTKLTQFLEISEKTLGGISFLFLFLHLFLISLPFKKNSVIKIKHNDAPPKNSQKNLGTVLVQWRFRWWSGDHKARAAF